MCAVFEKLSNKLNIHIMDAFCRTLCRFYTTVFQWCSWTCFSQLQYSEFSIIIIYSMASVSVSGLKLNIKLKTMYSELYCTWMVMKMDLETCSMSVCVTWCVIFHFYCILTFTWMKCLRDLLYHLPIHLVLLTADKRSKESKTK